MKKTPSVAHSRIPRTSRTECGLGEFEMPSGHGLGWRHAVTCKECLAKIEARRKAPRAEDKALAVEHFARVREVKQAQKAGPQ